MDRCHALDTPEMLPMPSGTTISAAFVTDSEGYSRWHDELIRRSGFTTSEPMSTPTVPTQPGDVFICYFDGDFGRPRGLPPSPWHDYSRFIIAIGIGGVDIVAMGWTDSLSIFAP